MPYLTGTPVEEKLTAIADAIRSKTSKTDKLNLDQMAESVPEVYDKGFEAGKQSGGDSYYDTFWDEYQVEGRRRNYQYAFAGLNWKGNAFRPKYGIIVSYGEYMFAANANEADLAQLLEALGISLDFSNCLGYNNMFLNSAFTRIPKIVDSGANATSIFSGCTKLVTIDEIELKKDVTVEQHYRTAFANCTALENIRFTGNGKLAYNINFQHSPLTAESIVSIVEHLSAGATGMTLTVKQTAIDNARFPVTSEKTGITYASWDELKATKQNWGFAYV